MGILEGGRCLDLFTNATLASYRRRFARRSRPQFAYLESCVTLAMVLRRFEFDFPERLGKGEVGYDEHPKNLSHPVGMRTGATIHTRQGLKMNVRKRSGVDGVVVDQGGEIEVKG